MQSNDNEQRTSKEGENEPERFEKGSEAHNLLDSADNMTLGNKLEKATAESKRETEEINASSTYNAPDPTKAAEDHGNEPSRGAKIDKEIIDEEKKYLERKGKI